MTSTIVLIIKTSIVRFHINFARFTNNWYLGQLGVAKGRVKIVKIIEGTLNGAQDNRNETIPSNNDLIVFIELSQGQKNITE